MRLIVIKRDNERRAFAARNEQHCTYYTHRKHHHAVIVIISGPDRSQSIGVRERAATATSAAAALRLATWRSQSFATILSPSTATGRFFAAAHSVPSQRRCWWQQHVVGRLQSALRSAPPPHPRSVHVGRIELMASFRCCCRRWCCCRPSVRSGRIELTQLHVDGGHDCGAFAGRLGAALCR